MRYFFLILTVVALVGCGKKEKLEPQAKAPAVPKAEAENPEPTPKIAPKKDARKVEAQMPEGVTVEFVVKKAQSYVPKGDFMRLYSEDSFMDEAIFVVQFPLKGAAEKLRVQDLAKHFMGKRIRASGKVGRIIFSSTPETRPGIYLRDVEQIKIISD